MKNPKGFKVAPTVQLFPVQPVMEKKKMVIMKRFHMSQVNNAAAKKSRNRLSTSIESVCGWKLSNETDSFRKEFLGNVLHNAKLEDCTKKGLVNAFFPSSLTRRLVTARSCALSSCNKENKRVDRGVVSEMLRNIESSVGSRQDQDEIMPTMRSFNGRFTSSLDLLFPLGSDQRDEDTVASFDIGRVNSILRRPMDDQQSRISDKDFISVSGEKGEGETNERTATIGSIKTKELEFEYQTIEIGSAGTIRQSVNTDVIKNDNENYMKKKPLEHDESSSSRYMSHNQIEASGSSLIHPCVHQSREQQPFDSVNVSDGVTQMKNKTEDPLSPELQLLQESIDPGLARQKEVLDDEFFLPPADDSSSDSGDSDVDKDEKRNASLSVDSGLPQVEEGHGIILNTEIIDNIDQSDDIFCLPSQQSSSDDESFSCQPLAELDNCTAKEISKNGDSMTSMDNRSLSEPHNEQAKETDASVLYVPSSSSQAFKTSHITNMGASLPPF